MSTCNPRPYAVVFEYTEKAGGYKGVRTWTAFKNKEDFDQWLADPGNGVLENQKIIAQGVTDNEAIKIVEGTSVEAYATACIEAATLGEGRIISRMALQCEVDNVTATMAITGSGDPERLVRLVNRLVHLSGRTVID